MLLLAWRTAAIKRPLSIQLEVRCAYTRARHPREHKIVGTQTVWLIRRQKMIAKAITATFAHPHVASPRRRQPSRLMMAADVLESKWVIFHWIKFIHRNYPENSLEITIHGWVQRRIVSMLKWMGRKLFLMEITNETHPHRFSVEDASMMCEATTKMVSNHMRALA